MADRTSNRASDQRTRAQAGPATARPVGLRPVGRLYTAAEVEAQTAQLVGERDAAVFELLDLRTEVRVLGQRVREQAVRLAEHPTRVERLTAECERWADRCGEAEADLATLTDSVRTLERQLADAKAERHDLVGTLARLAVAQ